MNLSEDKRISKKLAGCEVEVLKAGLDAEELENTNTEKRNNLRSRR